MSLEFFSLALIWGCCDLSECLPLDLQFSCWNYNAQCDGTRWGLWDGTKIMRILKMGTVTLYNEKSATRKILTGRASTLPLDFQSPEWWKVNVSKLASLWYFIRAARTDDARDKLEDQHTAAKILWTKLKTELGQWNILLAREDGWWPQFPTQTCM